jgi:voltage-gated potassium channel
MTLDAVRGRPRAGTAPLRQRVNALFDHGLPASLTQRVVNAFLATVIIANVVSVVVESVEWIRLAHGTLLWWVEQVATVVFIVEYVLRIWTAPERVNGRFRRPVWGRIHYACRPFALIDLIAILPPILGGVGVDDLRVLRLLRLLRMLKLSRHSPAFSLLWAVFREEARSIGAVLFIFVITLVLSASVMFMLENEAQPEVFSSIPAAMWWSIVTLTTVGYGDMVPVTAAGKVFGGVVSIIGIASLALFSGILTVSFMDQLRLRREQYRHLVEAGVQSGHLTPTDVKAIERIGLELGVPGTEAEEIFDEAICEHPPGTCPHCGHRLEEEKTG